MPALYKSRYRSHCHCSLRRAAAYNIIVTGHVRVREAEDGADREEQAAHEGVEPAVHARSYPGELEASSEASDVAEASIDRYLTGCRMRKV